MSLRIVGFLIFSVAGLALLLGLGIWQVQRLEWKTEILDRIDARIDDDPVPLPENAAEADDEYLAVRAAGEIGERALRVLVTTPDFGPSYRLIAPLVTEDARRVLVDLGAIPASADIVPRSGSVEVTGNLLWPEEVDGFTPDPDLGANIWFARDVPAMAEVLKTEPVLIVSREPVFDGILPLPITSAAIPNDHLQYAITWFSLAAIWAGMTVLLLWRMAGRQG